MRRLILLIAWLACIACAKDFLLMENLMENPAQVADPGFDVAYAQVPAVSLSVVGVGGEFGWGRSGDYDRYRLAFSGSYLEMDSLYRQVYSEWDFSTAWFSKGPSKENFGLVAGVGYGLSIDWVPEGNDFAGESWTSNRYKAGVALIKSPLSLSAMLSLLNHDSYFEFDYALALRFEGSRIGAFVEFDGKSLDVGDYLKFEHFAIYSVYRFPDFAMSVSIVFSIGNWNFSGAYGNAGSLWDWFGFSISKSIRKKTIL